MAKDGSYLMCSGLFAIKPVYANAILAGRKRFEYRKQRCKRDIKKIVIYATSPVSMIIGEVFVCAVLEAPVADLWGLTKELSGVGQEDFFRYYQGKKRAVAYELYAPYAYEAPLPLAAFGICSPPQSYIYLP